MTKTDAIVATDERHVREVWDSTAYDALLPEQLLPVRRVQELMPELRLAFAVLEDAVATLQTAFAVQTPRARMLASQAWAWIQSNDASHPFAFRAVCDHLGLDAEWLRRGLVPWRAAGSWNAADGAAPRKNREDLRRAVRASHFAM